MPRFVGEWQNALRIHDFRSQLFGSSIGLLVATTLLWVFLGYVETRTGAILNDPLLQLFPPVGMKWITYSFIYSGVLLGIVSLCMHPFLLLLAMRAYVVLIFLHVVCLFLVPLEPPVDAIPLVDPIGKFTNINLTFGRDLFFSLPTATMALFAFTAEWKDMKIIFACAAVAVSALLLLQHAQYTIDVVAAPCFAYAAYGLAKWRTMNDTSGPHLGRHLRHGVK